MTSDPPVTESNEAKLVKRVDQLEGAVRRLLDVLNLFHNKNRELQRRVEQLEKQQQGRQPKVIPVNGRLR